MDREVMLKEVIKIINKLQIYSEKELQSSYLGNNILLLG